MPKIFREGGVNTHGAILDLTQGRLKTLLEDERAKAGSVMSAYPRVARKVGASPSWVQRVLGRYDGVTVPAHIFLNIEAAYERLCERLEAKADQLNHKSGQLDAAHQRHVARHARGAAHDRPANPKQP